jgi:hypothetical protein
VPPIGPQTRVLHQRKVDILKESLRARDMLSARTMTKQHCISEGICCDGREGGGSEGTSASGRRLENHGV